MYYFDILINAEVKTNKTKCKAQLTNYRNKEREFPPTPIWPINL